ncbi:meiosis-specific nuclear structural protein 1-like [Synchiropus picturatus]
MKLNRNFNQELEMQNRRREQDQLMVEYIQEVDKDVRLQASLCENDCFDKRRYVRLHREQIKERLKEGARLQAEEKKETRRKQLALDERLAKELEEVECQKLKEEKIRQHIKENSIEIRELQSKLKLAYVNKGRADQLLEQNAIKQEQLVQEADFNRMRKDLLERADQEKERAVKQRQEEQLQYQRFLAKQIVERKHKKLEVHEEFLKEKLMVDDIIRQIYEKNEKERLEKLQKVKATQEYIEEFKKQQAEWKRMEQEKLDAENQRIIEFANHQEEMEEKRNAKLREMEEAKAVLHKVLSEKMEKEKRQREELERMRQEVHFEEQEEARRRKDLEEMEKAIQLRTFLQRTCQEQMAFKEKRKQLEKAEEEAFRKMLLAKFAEDDRLEQMNAHKRRMKQLEHNRQVEKLMEDRKRQHEMELLLEAQEREKEEAKEAMCRQIIEEERLKLLKRHARKLFGYLPKGLLREDDLQHFDDEFRKHYEPPAEDVYQEDS